MNTENREYYANQVHVVTGLYDVAIRFRIQMPRATEGEEEPVIDSQDACIVRMSPQHAKSLAALLVAQVREYEKAHDIKLPLPSKVQAVWDQYVGEEE